MINLCVCVLCLLRVLLCYVFTEIELGKYMSHLRLSDVFLDPLGHHLLLSLSSRNTEALAELLYLSRKTSKLKQVGLCLLTLV